MFENNIRIKNIILDFICIVIGTFFMACSTVLFLLPNQLSTGGFSGIGTIAYYFFNLPVGKVMLFLNIPLFLISFFRIGKGFLIKSILGTVLLSTFIDFLSRFPVVTTDRFLACIYGGVITGIGTAIILKANSSTGGSDLLSYIVKTYNDKFKTGDLIVIIDTIIIFVNVLFFKEIEVGLYSAIAIYLMGKMIDIIFEGINFTKALLIISPKYDEIAKEIGNRVDRGSTGLYSRGMYTNEEKMTLLCVGSRTESYLIQTIAKRIDKSAFIIILNAREVIGKGFK